MYLRAAQLESPFLIKPKSASLYLPWAQPIFLAPFNYFLLYSTPARDLGHYLAQISLQVLLTLALLLPHWLLLFSLLCWFLLFSLISKC